MKHNSVCNRLLQCAQSAEYVTTSLATDSLRPLAFRILLQHLLETSGKPVPPNTRGRRNGAGNGKQRKSLLSSDQYSSNW
jgi:hypothetical protein